jgi:hypothetical protein
VSVHDAGSEDPAVTRDRLKERFGRGATRRMTQLGMLIGVALDDLGPRVDDAIVYLSAYAETRALEAYLDSFPSASPTLFQTSIHPSAVQQALIGRQHPVAEFLPLTGQAHLVWSGVQAALTSPAARVLLCGGEEKGTWLLEQQLASPRSYAFAIALAADPTDAIGKVTLQSVEPASSAVASVYPLHAFSAALAMRTPIDVAAAPRQRLTLTWR